MGLCIRVEGLADLVVNGPQFFLQTLLIGSLSIFAFPLLSGTAAVGVLTFFGNNKNAPDTKLGELMRHIGAQLGRAVEGIAVNATADARIVRGGTERWLVVKDARIDA